MTTYTKETALYDTGAIAGDIAEAGTTASDYITAVTNDGIWVHPEGAGPVNGQPTANTSGWHISDAIELFRQGVSFIKMWVDNSVAKLRLGRGNESHVEIDFHSLKLIDKEGSTYFHVSDLRDADGLATIVEKSISDGTTRSIETRLWIYEVISVKVNGTDVEYTASDRVVTLQNTPLPDSEIVITYKTEDASAKAYTLGDRQDGEPIGPCSIVEGRYCVASGDTAYAEGYGNAANGDNSHAEGANTTASGRTAHSEGNYSVASGIGSHAEGRQTEATKSYAHAEGWGTGATETCAHAEGRDTTASGMYSHSEGLLSEAYGDACHAEGDHTNAYGLYTHAEGTSTLSSGTASHVEGYDSMATGNYSHAQNAHTIAQRACQTTIGKYNIADVGGTDETTLGDYALIVGNGTADNARSNALTVDWNGNVVAAGGLDLGTSLAIADGGTGATTAAAARANLAVPGLGTTNTFTASQVIKDGSIDRDGSAPSADDWSDRYACYYDKDGELLADWRCVQRASSNRIESIFRCWREVSGTAKENRITVGVNSDGSAYYWMSDAGAFRTALGLGTAATHETGDYAAASHNHAAGDITSGTLGLARGGTGQSLSAAPSMLTNLASTTAASPLAASPRPGVTGTLGKGHGGTGKTNTDTTYYGAKSLFSGTATTGNVTLSETAANYSMLLIQYRDNDSNYSSKLIISPNSKKVVLDMVYGVSGVGNLKSRTVTISGTSITTVSGSAMDAAHNGGAGTTNHIYITQVWGWK